MFFAILTKNRCINISIFITNIFIIFLLQIVKNVIYTITNSNLIKIFTVFSGIFSGIILIGFLICLVFNLSYLISQQDNVSDNLLEQGINIPTSNLNIYVWYDDNLIYLYISLLSISATMLFIYSIIYYSILNIFGICVTLFQFSLLILNFYYYYNQYITKIKPIVNCD